MGSLMRLSRMSSPSCGKGSAVAAGGGISTSTDFGGATLRVTVSPDTVITSGGIGHLRFFQIAVHHRYLLPSKSKDGPGGRQYVRYARQLPPMRGEHKGTDTC